VCRLAGILTAFAILLAGCGLQIPADPFGTLDRVRESGVLRVGVSPTPPWTVATEGSDPTGLEPALLARYAERLGATIEWEVGGEEALMGLMEEGELDVIVGGLTDRSPWIDKAALTRGYRESMTEEGESVRHVMAVRLGENAFMSDLERFLDGEVLGG
jgi:ABC-type amino acid transport substrate-binding protein